MRRERSRCDSKSTLSIPVERGSLRSRGWRIALFALILTNCRPAPDQGATLHVQAPDEHHDADVYVDGRYMGQLASLQGAQALALAPGAHRVEIRKPGRFPVQRTLRVGKTPLHETKITVEAELLENPLVRRD